MYSATKLLTKNIATDYKKRSIDIAAWWRNNVRKYNGYTRRNKDDNKKLASQKAQE